MIESLSSSLGDLSEQIAQRLLDLYAQNPLACARHTLILPTHRACQSIREAFLRLAKNNTVFLPRLVALYDIEPLSIKLPEVVPELERQMTLMRLCLKMRTSMPYDKAFQLAHSLGQLLDEMTLYEVPFSRLEEIVPDAFARHWQQTIDFLKIISQYWPNILGDRVDMMQKRVLCLDAWTKELEQQPPKDPIWTVGLTGGIPVVERLLKVLYHLPNTDLILTDFDNQLTENEWQQVDETHPQYTYKKLLSVLEIEPEKVKTPMTAQARLIHEIMRPALTTDKWKDVPPFTTQDIRHIRLLSLENTHQEAQAIALELRRVLETPDKKAMLVTPSRALARRVIAYARRWGIELNDSAGTPLSQTPTGVYLRLLLQDGTSQTDLLALCKHPLATNHMSQKAFRKMVHKTEITWRKDRQNADLALPDEVKMLMQLIQSQTKMDLPNWLEYHIKAAEALATSDDKTAQERLWTSEDGIEIIQLINQLKTAPALELTGTDYAAFITALLQQHNHRTHYGTHPRLQILGLVEARLQTADVVIVGGLNEGIFPAFAQTGPWLSRPIRQACQLPAPEENIGMAALDFTHLFLSPQVILTRALKQDGSQPLASRWIFRLKAVLQLSGLSCEEDDTANLDKPQHRQPALQAPTPCPPTEIRPQQLSVTEVDTLRDNSYNIYAKHVLNLSPLQELDDQRLNTTYGTAIHKALDNWYSLPFNKRTEKALRDYAQQAFTAYGLTSDMLVLQKPRFDKMVKWLLKQQQDTTSFTERRGHISWETTSDRTFTLTTRIDRIDLDPQKQATIIDYKTGTSCPKLSAIRDQQATQLPLEAAILSAGGVPDVEADAIQCLSYWHIDGKGPGGKIISLTNQLPALVQETLASTQALINAYETRPYTISQPGALYNDYAYLARIQEWNIPTGSDDDE
ncbi:MAG: PD-(D/E)XK nuclease family protein [Alphaproteobacteria bacterium]|nr:PD-(D/E)XK nuclease family protein [Alphaproteobacteria bacterium]